MEDYILIFMPINKGNFYFWASQTYLHGKKST
jgi:hypothetical protein